MIIRIAEEKDIDSLNKLFESLIIYEYQFDNNINENVQITSYFDNRINREHEIILVAEQDDELIGYVYSTIDYDNKIKKNIEAKIDSIFVKEKYRHHGIGTSLIKETIAMLNKQNINNIFITNIAANEPAKKLYEKIGFKIVKEERKLNL